MITPRSATTPRYWRHLGIGPRSFKFRRHAFYCEVYRWLRKQAVGTADPQS
jgi:hypothetical protein